MKEITALEVAKLLDASSDLSIIDVREKFEVMQGKIPGAINIPLGELPHRIAEIDRSKQHILVCLTGVRSFNATQFLEQLGYDVVNLSDGMVGWEQVNVKSEK